MFKVCEVCGKRFNARHRKMKCCSIVCGRKLAASKGGNRAKMPKATRKEIMQRIKLLLWIKRTGRLSAGAKPDINYHKLVEAWQYIEKIPLRIGG